MITSYSFIHYGFQGAEHLNPPHQNARKGSTPYKRTKPSTMKRIKEIAKDHKAKEIIEIIDSEKGSIEHIESVTDLPRDRQQIRNIRRNLFSIDHKDEFAAILQKCKVDNDEPFIRCIQAVPEPACIVATNHQLKQMEVNCTDENFSIVTVDPTFNLGEFYVTPMVFMQKKFVRKHTEQHPICLGPLLIHQRLNYSSYCYFATQLAILQPRLRHVRAIGTDGEQALHDAMLGTFTEAVPLRCFRHFRDNLICKLRELNVTECGQEEIMKDIFGGVTEDELHLGLVDSEDQDTFKAKLASLKD